MLNCRTGSIYDVEQSHDDTDNKTSIIGIMSITLELRSCSRYCRPFQLYNILYYVVPNVFSKVVEKVLYSRMQNWLLTTPNQQFGFKPKLGTEMCVIDLKELIRY